MENDKVVIDGNPVVDSGSTSVRNSIVGKNHNIVKSSRKGDDRDLRKRSRSRSSDSATGDESDDSSSTQRKKLKKTKKSKKKKLLKKKKSKKDKKRKKYKSESSSTSEDDSDDCNKRKSKRKCKKKSKDKSAAVGVKCVNAIENEPAFGPPVPDEVVAKSKSMAPMSKEEWERRQSEIRRVYDEDSGRYRLVKGDGEILEECVSRDRHLQINKQATAADGLYFQKNLSRK